ncbi:unnamed protein product [Porites evermanni]|uniref:Death domain-containing protein n=1 Tax=Porites evermanni TaxID=104178 RepID=A0ABN8LX35_9CNID|nr:unnamed protein product [Porites evermanni]
MKTNMTIVLFFSLSPTANCPCECDGTTVPKTISPPSGTAPYETQKAPTKPRPWFWAVVAGVTVVLVTTAVAVKWRKRRLNQNKGRQQSIPPVQRGLDTHIRDLTVEDREFISEWLNDQDSNGFCYWEKVAEKLGLQIHRYRQWRRADNPTVKLLTALAEDEESTIRKLIKASQEAGLTLFAKELGKRFSGPTNIQNGSNENV